MGMAAKQSQEEATVVGGEAPGMDIAEAAALLGVPVPTLRKRLQRGTQKGFKSEDGTWRVVLDETARSPIERQARRAVGRSMAEPARLAEWGRAAGTERREETPGQGAFDSASIELLAAEIRELREEVERNNALLESAQWQIAQLNPPGQFRHLQNHTETMIENQLRPVVSALMAVLDYLDREREEGRKDKQAATGR